MMGPILYRSYQRTEIDALFSKQMQPVVVAGTFLVTPKLVVCLVNTGAAEKPFHFNKPSELIWSPKAVAPEEADMIACQLPNSLEKAFASRRCRHLVFATNDAVNYQYVGTIQLASIAVRQPGARVASFHLTPKLSLDAWCKYSGYSDWQLTVNARSQSLSRDADIDAALAPYRESDIVEVFLTRYQEDYMHLVANGDSAIVTYVDEEAGVGMSSRNTNFGGKFQAITHLTGFDHADWDTPARNVVSRAEALELLKTFFRTGEPQGLILLKSRGRSGK